MAFRYRHLWRISSGLPAFVSGLRCQECGQSTKVFGSAFSRMLCTLEKVDSADVRASSFFSRFSTVVEISKEVSHEVDICLFVRSSFDHAEGPCHVWLNRSDQSKEFRKKGGPVLLLAEAFLEDHRVSEVERSVMLEKVKLLQHRYPWLHVIGLQSSASISSAADLNRLMNVVMDEYINFPILLCSKTFPEIADGACCFLFKDIRYRPVYDYKDVDLGNLQKAIEDLKQQLDKKVGDIDKLKSTWAKEPGSFTEPLFGSSLRNMLLCNPACISVDEDGGRLFLSDTNHHRVIVFDSNGSILDVIGSSPGFEDGDFETAKLMRPAASYYHASEGCLYIVDCENHAVRRADTGKRLVETLYPADNDKRRTGLWTWILDKLGLRRNAGMKSTEFDSETLSFPWHLLKSEDNDLLVMNRRFDTLWIINMDRGVIHNIVTGHRNILDICGEKVTEKVSCLKDITCNFLQKLVCSSYTLDGVTHSGLISSFVTLGDNLIICDRVGQRLLMLNKQTKIASSMNFSNFGSLSLPYWLCGSLERVFPTGSVSEEIPVDHVQSFKLFPGRIDIHLAIDIPENTELIEPVLKSCLWLQARGAAMEVSGLESIASSSEKVGVAQQWYDEFDNLAFDTEAEREVSTEGKTSSRNLDDGKIHIDCAVNTSPGTSEVTISAPLYLKLRNDLENHDDTQETKASLIGAILKAERAGKVGRDAFISYLLNLERELGDLVFIKPLHVKIKFDILNHPKPENSRDIILTDSTVDVIVSLN